MASLFNGLPRQSTLLAVRALRRTQLRHQVYRHSRTATATLATITNSGPATDRTSKEPTPSRWPRRILYMVLFGALGVYLGQKPRQMMSTPLTPGTPEDGIIVAYLRQKLESLPIVKELRSNPDYVEHEAYSGFAEDDKLHRLTSGPLRGSRGLAVQV